VLFETILEKQSHKGIGGVAMCLCHFRGVACSWNLCIYVVSISFFLFFPMHCVKRCEYMFAMEKCGGPLEVV
jgi:hypothetical protein